ncbi:hypothetical protein INR77_00400 [Erythrobacter sp. SCSIO 43205]|uniref:hypothetical protein n=1 Tax=Erythrobacter sp. SCSIO 43205 TaxID=2779361 RepID=UPI001CAA0453|nr:hypothetical protein [Erythrobacter sp. SCSIO 43205]UAB78253.1 hypothetical protein INR77_00400 [Erythrobacter sp. SCSIO 43205]
MKKLILLAAAIVVAAPILPLAAQDTVVVTGSRQDRSALNAYLGPSRGGSGSSAIGVTRRADYFVTPLFVSSDSRNFEERREELFTMLGETLRRADAQGIDIVAGRYGLEPVTLENMRELPLMGGNRPDTNRVQIFARIPLRGNDPKVSKTAERIQAFVKAIPATGRSFIDVGSTGLAIDDPEQYRGDVVRHIAKEATGYAKAFGNDYGVTITGLDGDLYFQQSSETEVFLYIEHSFEISPK